MGRMLFDFKGRSVVITGASRGIGLGIARAFAQAGATLLLLADDDAVVGVARQLASETGATVQGRVCDITDRAALRLAFEPLQQVDVLVNNAGLERLTPLAEPGDETERTFERILAVNVTGTYLVTREALGRMSAGGRIVVTSSIWGKTAAPEFSAYAASKHALIGLVRTWAKELGPRGITVNAVCPGWVETEAAMRSLHTMAGRAGRPVDELLQDIITAQALPGLMRPDDVAGAYLYLASDAAANITGQSINVDRGEVVW